MLFMTAGCELERREETEREMCTEKPSMDCCRLSDLLGGCESAITFCEPCDSCLTTTTEMLRRRVAHLVVDVGFHGKARVGKDYAADLVCAVDPGGFRKISFADPIRSFADAFFCGDWRAWKDGGSERLESFWGMTPRRFMQTAGEKIREISQLAFVQSARHRARDSQRVCVYHDVRHVNEAEMIRDEGGVVVGITDDGRGIHNGHKTFFRRVRDWFRGFFQHKTERAIPCDIWVVNDRGEDYECRLLEAILEAHDQRYTRSHS